MQMPCFPWSALDKRLSCRRTAYAAAIVVTAVHVTKNWSTFSHDHSWYYIQLSFVYLKLFFKKAVLSSGKYSKYLNFSSHFGSLVFGCFWRWIYSKENHATKMMKKPKTKLPKFVMSRAINSAGTKISSSYLATKKKLNRKADFFFKLQYFNNTKTIKSRIFPWFIALQMHCAACNFSCKM